MLKSKTVGLGAHFRDSQGARRHAERSEESGAAPGPSLRSARQHRRSAALARGFTSSFFVAMIDFWRQNSILVSLPSCANCVSRPSCSRANFATRLLYSLQGTCSNIHYEAPGCEPAFLATARPQCPTVFHGVARRVACSHPPSRREARTERIRRMG